MTKRANDLHEQAENTDRQLWAEDPTSYYSPSIHVTKDGMIGINCGGHVIVQSVHDWHRAALEFVCTCGCKVSSDEEPCDTAACQLRDGQS